MEIPVSDVKFDDATRIREELDESSLLELIESLKNVGQITPIVITRQGDLIAGRRRIEAAKRLSWSTIRAEYYEDLSEINKKIVEFDENDKRAALTWQEKAKAVKEIHDLKIAESRLTPHAADWTASDTARILGISKGAVSEELVLAVALDNPKVAGRPSRRGALDTVKRERELVLVRELARRRARALGLGNFDQSSTSLTGGVVYNADCREVLASMDEASVDLVVTDPPWGIDLDKASQWSRRWVASYDDREESVREMLVAVTPLLFKILRPSCHMYCFYPIQEIQWWFELFSSAGFICRQRSLIWFKTGQPGITDIYTSFLPAYESILWCYKPGTGDVRRLFARPVPEAQGFPREPTLWHENSKPVDMLQRWVEASSEINEVVLDPFCGGGSSLAAAFSVGRYYIGVEKDTAHAARSVERLRTLEARKEEGEVKDE